MGAAGLRVLPGRPPGPAFFGLFLVAPTPALAQADAGTGMLEQGLSLVRLGGPVVVVLLALAVALQRFEPVIRWNAQVIQSPGHVQLFQLAASHDFDVDETRAAAACRPWSDRRSGRAR